MNASDHHLCCLYCSKKSQELKQSSKQGSQSTTRPDSRSSSGLKCIKCQSFGCKVCLRALTKKLKEKVKHNKADTAILNADTWYREVMKYLGKRTIIPQTSWDPAAKSINQKNKVLPVLPLKRKHLNPLLLITGQKLTTLEVLSIFMNLDFWLIPPLIVSTFMVSANRRTVGPHLLVIV